MNSGSASLSCHLDELDRTDRKSAKLQISLNSSQERELASDNPCSSKRGLPPSPIFASLRPSALANGECPRRCRETAQNWASCRLSEERDSLSRLVVGIRRRNRPYLRIRSAGKNFQSECLAPLDLSRPTTKMIYSVREGLKIFSFKRTRNAEDCPHSVFRPGRTRDFLDRIRG